MLRWGGLIVAVAILSAAAGQTAPATPPAGAGRPVRSLAPCEPCRMPFLAVGQTVWVSVWGFEDSRQVTFYGSRQVGRDGRLSFPPPGGQADSIAVQAAGATPSDVRAAIIECLAARYTDLHVAVWSEGIDAVYQGLATRAPQPAAASRPSSRPSTLAASAPAR